MSRIVKQQRRYGCEWYLENDDGDLAWVAPMVKEHIERLEDENTKLRKDNDRLIQAVEDLHDVKLEDQLMQFENENEKLRKELELVGHIAVSNVVASIGREESLEAENAKLRELVADMWRDIPKSESCGWDIDANCCSGSDECKGECAYWYRMHELGIKVD